MAYQWLYGYSVTAYLNRYHGYWTHGENIRIVINFSSNETT